MSDMKTIYTLLLQNGIEITGEISHDPHGDRKYFAFVPTSRNKKNHQVPSNKKLWEIADELKKLGVELQFLLTDETGGDIEAGLRATLIHEFGGAVRNVFMTTSGKVAHVWLDLKREISEAERNAIRVQSGRFLSKFTIQVQSIQPLSSGRVPSSTTILKLLRIISPADQKSLFNEIINRNFEIPSSNWLSRKLDGLRKSGDIVRMDNGTYALSLSGIKRLGSSKSRSSPDIARVLALGAGKG